MNIKILFDPDGEYGYPKGAVISSTELIDNFVDGLNENEDADEIEFLRTTDECKAVDFIADLWGLDYEYIN